MIKELEYMNYDLAAAINSLRPGAQWSYSDDDYDTIVWQESNTTTKPTRAEVEAEMARLKAEYESKEYQRLRAKEYPDFRIYLDAVVKGDQEQLAAYIAACQAVKDKYPKT